jgi:hypothetical protein
MDIFHLSGTGNSQSLELSMCENLDRSPFEYLNPDLDVAPASIARVHAAARWTGLTIESKQAIGVRGKPYFEDATGPGFSLPGCTLCVSDRARNLLAPALRTQAIFLPIDIRGAPTQYWILYVTAFYGAIDTQRSYLRDAPSYVKDRRKELRTPVFLDSPELQSLYVFRVPGTATYVPFALGDFATQRFLDLVNEQGLGGFGFIRLRAKGEPLRPAESPVIVSKGPIYLPKWTG